MGRTSNRVYVGKFGTETWAFVPDPGVPSRWLRVHPCVIVVTCEACASPPGMPCKGKNGYAGWTHYHRRRDGKDKVAAIACTIGIVAERCRPRVPTLDEVAGG